jgi:multicomponent Na+:H+ antiporter subunit D
MKDWLIPFFVIVPLAGAFIVALVPRRKGYIADIIANLCSLLLLIASVYVISVTRSDQVFSYYVGNWPVPIGISMVLDGLSSLMLLTIAVVTAASSLYSIRYMEQFTWKSKFYSLFLLMVTGMNGVVLSGDFFNLFVFLEIASISSYALVGYGCRHEELEATFKYLTLGNIGALFVLLGVAFVYGISGTLNMADFSLRTIVASPETLYIILAFFMIGFGLKAALVPMHAWLPDAHPAAPTPISAMLSGVFIKATGVYALVRVTMNIFPASSVVREILLAFGGLSMVVGVFMAIGQWDLKRLLAYHSISQIGYVILGIGLGTPLGILGGLFHLVNHAAFKSLLFLGAGAVEFRTGTRQLKEMGGLRERMPVTTGSTLAASLAISGIPPFNGFFSKFIIIWAAVEAGRYGYAVAAVIVSVMTIASFMKVQKYAFFGPLRRAWESIREVPVTMQIVLVTMAVLCLAMSFLLIPLIGDTVLKPAVDAVLNGTGYSSYLGGL